MNIPDKSAKITARLGAAKEIPIPALDGRFSGVKKQLCIVTGGAGFLGCALSGQLAEHFERVIAVDCLHPQVHAHPLRPAALNEGVQLTVADVCDARTWEQLLDQAQGTFSVIHLAAETDTGQSLYEATRHAYTNVCGLTTMLDAFVRAGKIPEEILLTSSRAVYGEGEWEREDGTRFYPGQRDQAQLAHGEWDFPGAKYIPACAQTTQPMPSSIYGATKLAQEHILSAWCRSYGVNAKIARLQNVYGPGQSLVNAYAGVVALFARLAKAGQTIYLYEDGKIIRDFIFCDDVVEALIRMLDSDCVSGKVIDIGTGIETDLMQVAQFIADYYHAPEPVVSGEFRNGDVRCAACDVSRAKEMLNFEARYPLKNGLTKMCQWIERQK